MIKKYKIFLSLIIAIAVVMAPVSVSAAQPVLGSHQISLDQAVSPANGENAVLAASIIGGTVIQPGEIFSYNEAVGKRVPERGFVIGKLSSRGAPVYDYGGGICMTSSILHQAVTNAGLEVIERHNHVSPVGYLPQGEDAAVSWGIEDYKFKNTHTTAIQINAGVSDENIIIALTAVVPTYPEKSEQDYQTIVQLLMLKFYLAAFNILISV